MRGKAHCLRCKALRKEVNELKKYNNRLVKEVTRLKKNSQVNYVEGYLAGSKRLPLIR